jgi:hypothetical protein
MNDKLNIGDIVKFNDDAICRAAIFCREHGITGKIVNEQYGVYTIDTGFQYLVYARLHQLDKIVGQKDIPEAMDVE